jgi:uncharacterized membrane protein YvlD (DUF360 family)
VVRLIVRAFIALVASAVGLIVASIVLDGFDLNVSGFIGAVVIFTLVYVLFTPFLASQFRRANSAALGGVALIATLAALIITDLISNGVNISGLGTWIASTVIVWGSMVLAAFILPYLGLKKYLEERRES